MKLYSDESGAGEIRRIDFLVVSQLCRVEVPAGIWRKVRAGALDATSAAVLVAAFTAEYHGSSRGEGRFEVVAVDDAVLAEAAAFTRLHGLRAYDAVQLAAATAARRADPGCTDFACFDQALRMAAASEAFRLVPAAV